MDFGAGWWEGWVGVGGGGVWSVGGGEEGAGVRSGWRGEWDRVDGMLEVVVWGNLSGILLFERSRVY